MFALPAHSSVLLQFASECTQRGITNERRRALKIERDETKTSGARQMGQETELLASHIILHVVVNEFDGRLDHGGKVQDRVARGGVCISCDGFSSEMMLQHTIRERGQKQVGTVGGLIHEKSGAIVHYDNVVKIAAGRTNGRRSGNGRGGDGRRIRRGSSGGRRKGGVGRLERDRG